MHLVYFSDSSVSRATAALFIGLTLGLAAACDKVPLLAPTESTLNLAISTTTLPVNGTAQVVATVIEPAGTPVHNGTMVTFIGSLGTFFALLGDDGSMTGRLRGRPARCPVCLLRVRRRSLPGA